MDRNILEDFTRSIPGRVLPLRTATDPLNLVLPCKSGAEIDKDQALFEVHTMEEALADRVGFPRFRKMRLFWNIRRLGPGNWRPWEFMACVVRGYQRTHELGCEWLWARDAAMFWEWSSAGPSKRLLSVWP